VFRRQTNKLNQQWNFFPRRSPYNPRTVHAARVKFDNNQLSAIETMATTLPPEILVLVCEELGNRQDFQTLFFCALAGKPLVRSALSWLYRSVIVGLFCLMCRLSKGRIHNQSDYFRDDEPDTATPVSWQEGRALQIRTTAKWALLWQSIIRSSLGTTAYPYCLYIRSLDLRNLDSLLEDTFFRSACLDTFFADEMSNFLKAQDASLNAGQKETRLGKSAYLRLNVAGILDSVGESITTYVADSAVRDRVIVALEDISGNINTAALQKWASRLSRLKTLTLFDGSVLNEGVADVINRHCPDFDDLMFCFCMQANVDSDIAGFFSTLRPNSLRSFTAFSAQSIGPETFLALNNHRLSLRVLKLHELKSNAIKTLSLLQGCEALEILHLQDDDGLINLKETENDVYLEVIAWLGRCKRLQELRLQNLLSAPSILTELCLCNDIRLRKLELTNYPLVNNQDFHKAMSHQTSLESLILRADSEVSFKEDIDILVSSVCQLTGLRELDLCETSEPFRSPEISRVASSLQKLEKFSFSGYDVSDKIWPSISGLPYLRALNAHAITSFSFDGLLNYVSRLQPTNQGLVLSVMCQGLDYDLSDHHKALIQKSIEEKVDGRFEFVLYIESDSSYDSASD
jgi:hypothetical protein